MARRTQTLSSKADIELAKEIGKFVFRPYDYTLFAYPWSEPGTILKDHDGPDDWQRDALIDLGNDLRRARTTDAEMGAIQYAFASGHSIGKCLIHNEKIATPEGYEEIGNLQPGDLVLGGDGAPTTVMGVFDNGVKPTFRIRFDDGDSILCTAEHQWLVYKGRAARSEIATTEQMLADNKNRYYIPLCEPLEFSPQEHLIHPYVLGYLLGNGNFCTASAIRVASPDEEVFRHIAAFLPAEYGVYGTDPAYKHLSRGELGNTPNGMVREVERLALTKVSAANKFVPNEYLHDSVDNRVWLLRGLMDSDGTISERKGAGGRCRLQFSTASEKLRDNVVWLVKSLGGKATYYTTDRVGIERNGFTSRYPVHTVMLNMRDDINPFLLSRKADKYTAWKALPIRRNRLRRRIEAITPEGEARCFCIAVDNAEKLYTTYDDLIVTHNTAWSSWLIRWFMATQPAANIVATSNTRTQLLTKLWREVARWHKLAIDSHMFEWTATTYYHVEHPETWRANAIAWSEENSEAFAGLHEDNVMVLYDEASAVSDKIWEVTKGAMATTGAIWVATGNPTRNTGHFRECFPGGQFAKRWKTRNIDSRSCKMTNKVQLNEWLEDYGEDSDFARVRVKGQFPRAGSTQFIGGDVVDRAMGNVVVRDPGALRILGVDVARYGDDATVLAPREPNIWLPSEKYNGLSTMEVADKVARKIDMWQPDATFVDGNGLGAGVVDRLVQLNYSVIDVQFGAKAEEELKFRNKRAECWGRMRDWLGGDVQITKNEALKRELTSPEYGLTDKMQIQLEKKKDIKKRLGFSPDEADAYSLTYAEPVRTVRLQAYERSFEKLQERRKTRSYRCY